MLCGLLTMGFPWALLFWAEQHVSGALGAIMNATVPIVVVLLNPVVNPGIRILLRQWAGVLLAFVGVVVIFGPRVINGPASSTLALLALLGMVLCYASALLYTHRYLKGVPAALVAEWQGVSAGGFLLVVALASGEDVIASASLITFLIPVFSLLIEWVWLGQSPGHSSLSGLLLVIIGLYMVQFYKGRRFRRVPLIPPTEEAAIGE